MIYTCSMFFNEFKLLDLKIAEQLDHVDKMVIVEAEMTHSNKPKPILLQNHPDYNHHKLEKVLVKANEFKNNALYNEAYQRNATMFNRKINDDDIIISCDLDEIIPAHDFPEIVDKIKEFEYVRFGMQLYYYKINLRMGTWRSPIGITGKFLKESGKTITQLRHARKGEVIRTNGKHFSYLATPEEIENKLRSFCHHKMATKINLNKVIQSVTNGDDLFQRGNRKGEIVEIDETYPKTIRDNLENWKNLIA